MKECGLDLKGVAFLASNLHKLNFLKTINLSDNDLADSGIKGVIQGLCRRQLSMLRLHNIGLGKHNKTYTLNLQNFSIGELDRGKNSFLLQDTTLELTLDNVVMERLVLNDWGFKEKGKLALTVNQSEVSLLGYLIIGFHQIF